MCESRSRYTEMVVVVVVVVVVLGGCVSGVGRSQATPWSACYIQLEVCCNKTTWGEIRGSPQLRVEVATKYCGRTQKPWE